MQPGQVPLPPDGFESNKHRQARLSNQTLGLAASPQKEFGTMAYSDKVVDHYNNPIARSLAWDTLKSIPPGPIARAGTAAIIIYLIVSEGSRLYPPRNLVPVP